MGLKIPVDDASFVTEFITHFQNRKENLDKYVATLEENKSLEVVEMLFQEIKQLDVQARLAGISFLQPFFTSFSRLLATVHPDIEIEMEPLTSILKKLLSSLARILSDFSQSLEQAEEGESVVVETDVDEKRLDSLFAQAERMAEKYEQTPYIDMSEPVFAPPLEILSQYVLEGIDFLSHLRDNVQLLCDTEQKIKGLKGVTQALKKLYGNTELIIGLSEDAPSPDHPIIQIKAVLQRLGGITDILEQTGSSTVDMTTLSPFVQAVDILHTLFENMMSAQDEMIVIDELIGALDTCKERVEKIRHTDDVSFKSGTEDLEAQVIKGSSKTIDSEEEEVFIPVSQERLDQMTNLVGELVVAKNTLTHVQSMMHEGIHTRGISESLNRSEKIFGRIISDLDKVVMGMRMQRVKDLFQRFPRLVRDLAKRNEKKIKIVFEGEETELDNLILKVIADPLMHLVRNSCDHGLEGPMERKEKGKPETGILKLTARQEGGRITIEIYDDGRGIDPEVMKRKAIEKGVLSAREAEQLDDAKARELIFMPGFSTAKEVTDISGRGVGMDVVNQNIASVKGEVSIESCVGEFTRIKLLLPLTMSISKGLKVMVSGQIFIVPLENVLNMLCVNKKQVQSHKNNFFLPLQDKTVAISVLARCLNLNEADNLRDYEQLNIVLLDIDLTTIGVIVDTILEIEEIVLKPLPGNMCKLPFFSGCSIMSNGAVVPVLNPKMLV
ncbi:MAG: chemotaxis protein CheA [Thermodesulfobacteriota bacterium]|nr:chemotaxis protein CheA [Thermodesulfobacteriota bacterium]